MFPRLGLRDGLTGRGVRVPHGPKRRGLDGGEFRTVPVIRPHLGSILHGFLGEVERCRMEHGERVDHLCAGRLFVGTLGLLVKP